MQNSEYMILSELFAAVERQKKIHDLALELSPLEIVTDARKHLANGPMTGGDADAWRILGWSQAQILDPEPAPVCYITYEADKAEVHCKEQVVSWCGDCGEHICQYHLVTCCSENRCDHCQFLHRATFHKWLDTQLN